MPLDRSLPCTGNDYRADQGQPNPRSNENMVPSNIHLSRHRYLVINNVVIGLIGLFSARRPQSACMLSRPNPVIPPLHDGFTHPPDDCRIMVRWWWFGPAATNPEIQRELEQMKAAGIGGVEIATLYPARPRRSLDRIPQLRLRLRRAPRPPALRRGRGAPSWPPCRRHTRKRLALRRSAHPGHAGRRSFTRRSRSGPHRKPHRSPCHRSKQARS